MNIVGITSCTCGIAHTYMAREKLLETGEKFGWSVKSKHREAVVLNLR